MNRRACLATVFGTAILLIGGLSAAKTSLVVRDAWARATPPGSDAAAVYLTIVGGDVPDRLVSASTSAASMSHVHTVDQSGGMSRMRPADGVPVAAGETVVLAPGGLHLMLMHLARPLVVGQRFVVSLEFERAGRIDVEVAVLAPVATSPAR